MLVADPEIFLIVSGLLWSFEMTELPATPINLEEYSGLSGRSPVAFKVLLKKRHALVEKVVEAASRYDSTSGLDGYGIE